MSFLHEHIILPLSDLIKGEHTAKYLRLLKEAESWSAEQMTNFQNARLQQLVQYAAAKVPFYRDWFRQSGINPKDIKSIDDLHLLPIVDKPLMRGEGISRFAAEGFPESQRLYYRLFLHNSGVFEVISWLNPFSVPNLIWMFCLS